MYLLNNIEKIVLKVITCTYIPLLFDKQKKNEYKNKINHLLVFQTYTVAHASQQGLITITRLCLSRLKST